MYWADVYFHGNTVFITANFGMFVKEVGNDKFCILLHVRVLNKEGGAELTELSKLDLAGPVLVDFMQQVLQLILSGAEAHRPHDLAEIIS